MAPALILRSFSAALGQLSDPPFCRVFLTGVGLTLLLLIAVTVAVVWLLNAALPEAMALPLLGEVNWIDDIASWGAVLLMLVLSVFLMVPVASAITALFLDQVAEAVEARHYPQAGRAQEVPWGEALRDGVNFLGLLVAANAVALVLYLFLPPAAPFIFWGLNGYLLGREYFQMVAIRWLGRTAAADLRRRHSGTVWLAGILMTVPLSIPLLNLVIPVLGAATFTHLFHGLTRPRP